MKEQMRFWKAAGIQTVACVPCSYCVLALGSTDIVKENPTLGHQLEDLISPNATDILQKIQSGMPSAGFVHAMDVQRAVTPLLFLQDELSFSSNNPFSHFSIPTSVADCGLDFGQQRLRAMLTHLTSGRSVGSHAVLPGTLSPCYPSPTVSRLDSSASLEAPTSVSINRSQDSEIVEPIGFEVQARDAEHSAPSGILSSSVEDQFQLHEISTPVSSVYSDEPNFLSLHAISTGNASSAMEPMEQMQLRDSTMPQIQGISLDWSTSGGFKKWTPDISIGSANPLAATNRKVHGQKILKSFLFYLVPQIQAQKKIQSNQAHKHRQPVPSQDEPITSFRRGDQLRQHRMAERRRRRELNECFITLKNLVPGKPKSAKISILEMSIDYIKQLQDQVKDLQERNDAFERTTAAASASHRIQGEGSSVEAQKLR